VTRSRSEEATEEPTPRRLAAARRRGEIAFSRELTSATALLAAFVLVVLGGPGTFARVLTYVREALAAAPRGGAPGTALSAAAPVVAWTLAPVLGAAMLAALAVGLGQTGGLVTAPLRVDARRLLSASSWRRLVSGRAALEGGRALLMVGVIAVLSGLTLQPVLGGLLVLTGAPAPRLLNVLGTMAERLGLRLVLAVLAFGIVDYALALRRHRRSLRMTRQEVKRDYKESEGDPVHRGERQRLQRELLQQRTVDEVRKAHFVVVNPEPIAVALRYEGTVAAAPVVVAKGQRLVAERIKQVARQAGVPIFHDVSLARALDELTEGGEIPTTLYEAVAELLRVVRGASGAIGDGGNGKPV
jgi:type III secretion protein U